MKVAFLIFPRHSFGGKSKKVLPLQRKIIDRCYDDFDMSSSMLFGAADNVLADSVHHTSCADFCLHVGGGRGCASVEA